MIRRLILIVFILGLLGVALWASWQRLRERYVLPWLGTTIAQQVEQRTGWRLTYRSIAGSLINSLDLYAVRIEPRRAPSWFTGDPADLVIEADHVRVTYALPDLLRQRILGVQVEGPSLRLGSVKLAMAVAQVGDLLAVALPKQTVNLADLRAVVRLPKELDAQGRVEIEGECMLKRYRPHLVQVQLRALDVRVRHGITLDARADVDLALHGAVKSPTLDGVVVLSRGRWTGVGAKPFSNAFGQRKAGAAPRSPLNHFPGTINVRLTGTNLWLQTDQLRARLRGDVVLRKAPQETARFVGTLQAIDGIYSGKGRRFALRSGEITLPDRAGASPLLSATLETRIKRYRIQAIVSGTLRDSHLTLRSQPELSSDDILALMVFGRRAQRLNAEEREQLAQDDASAQALDMLFLGRAELIAARWLGVDEINVHMAPLDRQQELGPTSVTGTRPGSPVPIESVEIGKYVIPDRLFGSYQLEPNQIEGEPMKHTLGAEYELTDSFSVGATVKAAVRDRNTVGTEPDQAGQALPQEPSHRRLEAEEAFIRFRWKF